MLRIRCLVFMVVIFCCNKANDAACTNENILEGGLKENHKLWRHLLYEIQVISPIHCADTCLRDNRCKSFTFKRNQTKEGTYSCQIHNTKWNKKSEPGMVTAPVAGSDLYNIGFEDLHKILLHPGNSCDD